MTDYTITTNFGAKDSLPSGNAGKVIKGSEFTTEFTNIQTAVNTKADTAGDTFTGVVNFSADVAVNTNTLFVDVSENKVGIGTTTPDVALDIERTNATDNSNVPTLRFTDNDTSSLEGQKSGQIEFFSNDNNPDSAGVHSFINGQTENNSGYGALVFGTGQTGSSAERMRIDSSGNVGIGTSSPAKKLHVLGGDVRIESTFPRLYLTDTNNNSDYSIINNNGQFGIYDDTNATYRMVINNTTGKVGIGTDSPDRPLDITDDANDGTGGLVIHSYLPTLELDDISGSGTSFILQHDATNTLFKHDTTERMRIDSSGNLLVGTTDSNVSNNSGTANSGINLLATGQIFAAYGGNTANFNRLGSDGSILNFDKDGTTVGSIGTVGGDMYLVTGARGIHISDGANSIVPCNATGGDSDATTSLGLSSARFKDLYRSGSTYSTSDRNKKQDIRDLTDAEARVAVVAKGSLKAFRYIDTVEAEGDDANIHFGIIAQDLKAAFEAEGLNADNYQVLKTSTYTDDDGVEQTTYSVCYENLLAFIISAI